MATPLADKYGRYVAGSEVDFGICGAGQMRGGVFDTLSLPMWVRELRVWAGVNSGSPAITLGIYALDSNDKPQTRLARTGQTNPVTPMTGPGGGAAQGGALAVIDESPSDTALLLMPGRYAIALLSTGGTMGFSMREAAAISAADKNFYDRTGLGQPVPMSYGTYTPSFEGHISMWAAGEYNSRPDRPVNRTPSVEVNTLTPVFGAHFRDDNGRWGSANGSGIDRGDRLNRFRIQVYRTSANVRLWNATLSATVDEQNEDRFERVYAGQPLAFGGAYYWITQVEDLAGEWSEWTDPLHFTVANQGFVTPGPDPTGTLQVLQTDFDGTWTHQTGLAMNRAQVRLYEQVGNQDVLIATSPEVVKAANHGQAFTVTAAEAGFAGRAWGKTYKFAIRGRDTANNWSDYSAKQQFKTNAAPTIPANLSPAGGEIRTDFPTIEAIWSDADDTPATGLTGTFEITRPDASVVLVTPTFNAVTGKWEFPTGPAELNQFGLYTVRARSFDGTVYSGGTTVEANATWSAPAPFQYAQGPTVTITAPTEGQVLDDATPTIAWTAPGQAKREIRLFDDGGSVPIFRHPAAGFETSSVQNFTLPAGVVRDGGDYDLVVGVEDGVPLQGFSAVRSFSVSYTPPPDLTGVDAEPHSLNLDPWPTAIRVRWDPSTLGATFGGYYVYRRAVGESPAAAMLMAKLTSVGSTTWIDYHAPSGIEWVYTVRQVERRESGEVVESAGVEVSAALAFEGLVLVSVTRPETARAILHFHQEFAEDLDELKVRHRPLSGGPPVTVFFGSSHWRLPGTFDLIDETLIGGPTARERYAQVKACAELPAADGRTFSARDHLSNLWFVTIDGLTLKHVRPIRFVVDLELVQEQYSVAVQP